MLLSFLTPSLPASPDGGGAAHGRGIPDITVADNLTIMPSIISGPGTTHVHIFAYVINVGNNSTGAFDVQAYLTCLSCGPDHHEVVEVHDLAPDNATLVSFDFDLLTNNYSVKIEADYTGRVTESNETNNTALASIHANALPVAVISGPKTVYAQADQEVLFDGSGSYDPDGTIGSYVWDMGDGSISYSGIVTHSYRRGGNYKVTLTVADEHGSKGIDTVYVQVDSPPRIFDWYPKDDISINEGETLRFWVQAVDPEGNDIEITWRHSGAIAASGPEYLAWFDYGSEGMRTIDVEVSDGTMTSERSWVIMVLDSIPLIVSQWPEGLISVFEGEDLTVGYEPSPAAIDADSQWTLDGQWFAKGSQNVTLHTVPGSAGNHTVRVDVWDGYVFDAVSWSFEVRPFESRPGIRWYEPKEDIVDINKGEDVWFSIGVQGGGEVTWLVDGSVVTAAGQGMSLEVSGLLVGAHNVSASVSAGGEIINRSWSVYVNGPPTAKISSGSKELDVGGEAMLSASSSSDDIEVTGYVWELGEGVEVVKGGTEIGGRMIGAVELTLRFTAPGTYKVILTVSDDGGLEDSDDVTFVVRPEKEPAQTPGPGVAISLVALIIAMHAIAARRFTT